MHSKMSWKIRDDKKKEETKPWERTLRQKFPRRK